MADEISFTTRTREISLLGGNHSEALQEWRKHCLLQSIVAQLAGQRNRLKLEGNDFETVPVRLKVILYLKERRFDQLCRDREVNSAIENMTFIHTQTVIHTIDKIIHCIHLSFHLKAQKIIIKFGEKQ